MLFYTKFKYVTVNYGPLYKLETTVELHGMFAHL